MKWIVEVRCRVGFGKCRGEGWCIWDFWCGAMGWAIGTPNQTGVFEFLLPILSSSSINLIQMLDVGEADDL